MKKIVCGEADDKDIFFRYLGEREVLSLFMLYLKRYVIIREDIMFLCSKRCIEIFK